MIMDQNGQCTLILHINRYGNLQISLSLMTKWTKILMTHLAGLCFFCPIEWECSRPINWKHHLSLTIRRKWLVIYFLCALFPFLTIKWLQKKFVLNASLLFSSIVQVKCDLIRPWHKLLAILRRNEPVSCFSIRHKTGFCTDFMIRLQYIRYNTCQRKHVLPVIWYIIIILKVKSTVYLFLDIINTEI